MKAHTGQLAARCEEKDGYSVWGLIWNGEWWCQPRHMIGYLIKTKVSDWLSPWPGLLHASHRLICSCGSAQVGPIYFSLHPAFICPSHHLSVILPSSFSASHCPICITQPCQDLCVYLIIILSSTCTHHSLMHSAAVHYSHLTFFFHHALCASLFIVYQYPSFPSSSPLVFLSATSPPSSAELISPPHADKVKRWLRGAIYQGSVLLTVEATGRIRGGLKYDLGGDKK